MRFSLESYREILDAALAAGRRPAGFEDGPPGPDALLLRHDVDYSLAMAVSVAEVNHAAGISGTFFLLLDGHAYNLLSPASQERVARLVELGQRIGLHLRPRPVAEVARAHAYVAGVYPALLPVFSWHNPVPEVIDRHRLDIRVADLINAYADAFVAAADYVSDSNLRHTPAQLADAVRRPGRPIHLLLHPINWVAGGDTMTEVFEHAWPWLVRECEEEARTNRSYAELLPRGMPDGVTASLARAWREAADGHA